MHACNFFGKRTTIPRSGNGSNGDNLGTIATMMAKIKTNTIEKTVPQVKAMFALK